jgi:hypothetical protein
VTLTECIRTLWAFITKLEPTSSVGLKAALQERFGEGVVVFAPFSHPEFEKSIVGEVRIDTDQIADAELPGWAAFPLKIESNIVNTEGWETHRVRLHGDPS